MKCSDCNSCKKGWFKSEPEKHVCIGVKHPFVIEDTNKECSQYKRLDIQTAEISKPEPAKAFVDDEGIYVPLDSDPMYHKMVISKELFVEAYNKWIKGETK